MSLQVIGCIQSGELQVLKLICKVCGRAKDLKSFEVIPICDSCVKKFNQRRRKNGR
jgi:uncharacterized CHY-type Zn-finger protein